MSLSVFPKSHCCFQHQFTLHHAQQRKSGKIEFKILKAFFHRILSLFAVILKTISVEFSRKQLWLRRKKCSRGTFCRKSIMIQRRRRNASSGALLKSTKIKLNFMACYDKFPLFPSCVLFRYCSLPRPKSSRWFRFDFFAFAIIVGIIFISNFSSLPLVLASGGLLCECRECDFEKSWRFSK